MNLFWLETAMQIWIALTGVLALWMGLRRPHLRMWASLIALSGQPIWFVETARAQQWGMFSLAVIYTVVWLNELILAYFERKPNVDQT
jgi:hypothetical protein